MVGPSRARDILSSIGWLSLQPDQFRADVFKRANSVKFAAGKVIFRPGDALSGIYGVVNGAAFVGVAPQNATPHPLHMLTPGGWVGEACFLSREPRRFGLQAAIDTTAIYLPLEDMDQMASQDPMATRRFTQILMINLDIVLRAFYDLQDPDEHRRIARALCRIVPMENTPMPLAQSALAMLANSSSKTVSAALSRFAKAGWATSGYRSVTVTDLAGLTLFARTEIV